MPDRRGGESAPASTATARYARNGYGAGRFRPARTPRSRRTARRRRRRGPGDGGVPGPGKEVRCDEVAHDRPHVFQREGLGRDNRPERGGGRFDSGRGSPAWRARAIRPAPPSPISQMSLKALLWPAPGITTSRLGRGERVERRADAGDGSDLVVARGPAAQACRARARWVRWRQRRAPTRREWWDRRPRTGRMPAAGAVCDGKHDVVVEELLEDPPGRRSSDSSSATVSLSTCTLVFGTAEDGPGGYRPRRGSRARPPRTPGREVGGEERGLKTERKCPVGKQHNREPTPFHCVHVSVRVGLERWVDLRRQQQLRTAGEVGVRG